MTIKHYLVLYYYCYDKNMDYKIYKTLHIRVGNVRQNWNENNRNIDDRDTKNGKIDIHHVSQNEVNA